MKKIAFFDLDGTLFRWQLFHALVYELKDRGLFSQQDTDELDAKLIDWQARRISWHDYEMTVVRTVHAQLPTISPDDFEASARAIVEQSGNKVYRYTKQLATALKNDGYTIVAITGSHQEIAQPFAELYGFDDTIGVIEERIDGKFTGKRVREVFSDKARLVREYVEQHGYTWQDSLAIGDSHGDIQMLELVDRPIAFNPSEELLETAEAKGWEVVIERKTVAYHLQKGDDGLYVLAKTDRFQTAVSKY